MTRCQRQTRALPAAIAPAVRFAVAGPLRPVVACHGSICRKTSGHHVATTSAARGDVTVEGELRWYASSPRARRGVCPVCGSSLFWDGTPGRLSISAGSLDAPTGLRLAGHIYCADKGDDYDIADGLTRTPGEDPDLTSA